VHENLLQKGKIIMRVSRCVGTKNELLTDETSDIKY